MKTSSDRRLNGFKIAARWTLAAASISGAAGMACSSADIPPLLVNGRAENGGAWAAVTPSSASTSDAGAAEDAGLAVGFASSSDGDAAAANASDALPPQGADGSTADGGAGIDSGTIVSDEQCSKKWWASGSVFDTTITPAAFASALNPIVSSSSIHPFTLAMQLGEDGGWAAMASGTTMDGSGNQYFPVAYATAATAMSLTGTSVATVNPVTTAWFHVDDAGGNDLWIPIANVGLSATFGESGCSTLQGGWLTAVIQSSAAAMTIQPIGGSPTTLASLLGPYTSSSPVGWTVAMAFNGTTVQVD